MFLQTNERSYFFCSCTAPSVRSTLKSNKCLSWTGLCAYMNLLFRNLNIYTWIYTPIVANDAFIKWLEIIVTGFSHLKSKFSIHLQIKITELSFSLKLHDAEIVARKKPHRSKKRIGRKIRTAMVKEGMGGTRGWMVWIISWNFSIACNLYVFGDEPEYNT